MPARAFRSARQHLIRTDARIQQALRQVMIDTADELKANVERTVSDWSHKPRFRKQNTFTPAYISIVIQPSGNNATIFSYVDQGTEGPYRIPKFPRVDPQTGKPTLLKFRTNYSARTAPVARHHLGSGRASGPFVSVAQVTHPGIEPRLFLETLSDELKPTLDRRVDNAIRRILR